MRPVQGWTALWASVERRWRATEIVAQGRVATSATKPRPHVFKFDAPQTVTTGGQVREIQPLADLDFNVKVADFGCSKQGLDMSTSFHGTRIDRVLLLDDAPRQALVLSCEVPGEEPLPGARYNAEKLSKFFRRANVPARCVYGGKLTLDRAKEDIRDFFSTHCEVHVLYGIFHGHAGSWKLSDGKLLGFDDIFAAVGFCGATWNGPMPSDCF
eukprot:s2049_g10.t2